MTYDPKLCPTKRLKAYCKWTPEGCWEWTRCKRKGYGNMRVAGKNMSSHRVSFLVFIGAIPEGMIVCHSCDNPTCCNPEHLFLDNAKGNAQDMVKKGRSLKGKKNAQYIDGRFCDDPKAYRRQQMRTLRKKKKMAATLCDPLWVRIP